MAVSSAYRTRSDLIVAALGKLGVVASNQVPDVEDVVYVDNEIDSIFRKLEGLELVYVADRGQPGPAGGSIPGQYFDDLAAIVADLCSAKFGSAAQDAASFTQKGLGMPPGTGAAALSLQKISRGRATFEVQTAEYF
jgi:hypothetical protein